MDKGRVRKKSDSQVPQKREQGARETPETRFHIFKVLETREKGRRRDSRTVERELVSGGPAVALADPDGPTDPRAVGHVAGRYEYCAPGG